MATYCPGERAYLLSLRASTPYMSWSEITDAIIAEAPRHFPGGDLNETDPWPPRRYAATNIQQSCARWMKARGLGVRPDIGPVIRGGVGFVPNDEQPEPPRDFMAANINAQTLIFRPQAHQLPSLREVLNSSYNYPQPILNRNLRIVWDSPGQSDERHHLADAPTRQETDDHPNEPARMEDFQATPPTRSLGMQVLKRQESKGKGIDRMEHPKYQSPYATPEKKEEDRQEPDA